MAEINTCKLFCALVNTNRQNNLYYGTTNKCPCCHTEVDTFSHVLNCGGEEATKARQEAFLQLITTSKQLGTPKPILNTIQHSSSNWISDTAPSMVKALWLGSLHVGDIYLTVAFTEQCHSIGWHHLFLVWFTRSWEKAYMAYKGRQTTNATALYWSSAVITSFWEYTRQLLSFWNQVLHGTEEEQATKILQTLQEEVKILYTSFQHNPAIILPWHHHLFTCKSLDNRLRQPYDNIQCWTRFVAEACEDLQHQEDIRWLESAHFFPTPSQESASTIPHDTSNSSYNSASANYALDSLSQSLASCLGFSANSSNTDSLASTITFFVFPSHLLYPAAAIRSPLLVLQKW